MAVRQDYWKDIPGDWELADYPDVKPRDVEFSQEIGIAYAVCGKECGYREFIVDCSTQICTYCGRTMFRTEVAMYALVQGGEKAS
jgi:hypothetical protein